MMRIQIRRSGSSASSFNVLSHASFFECAATGDLPCFLPMRPAYRFMSRISREMKPTSPLVVWANSNTIGAGVGDVSGIAGAALSATASDIEADYVVVGRSAGCVLANRLSADGSRVVLLGPARKLASDDPCRRAS
jgi:hypothetical protein